jgi:methionyl-tRNA formyltransferase
MKLLLLGGTDLTLAVGERIRDLGIEIGALVYVGKRFEISYSSGAVTNSRVIDAQAWCTAHGIPAWRYESAAELERLVAKGQFDVGLVAGWYHMLPRVIRERFPRGCLGVHASLLPQLRGGAPLNWALLSGARETGVSLFELGDGVDDGPLYGQRGFAIAERATIADLIALAESVTLDLVEDALPRVLRGELDSVPQTGTPSYCLQRTPEDGRIDWRRSASDIDLLVRAVGHPYPGACTELDGRDVYVWSAEPMRYGPAVFGTPGQIASLPEEADPCVVTGEGTLVLRDVTDVEGCSVLDELRRSANRRFTSSASVG